MHGHYGEILYQRDILVTFLNEKSRSGECGTHGKIY
jgi:hypothetical protein